MRYGGHHEETSVEILDPMGRVFYRASGRDNESMHVAWVDLSTRIGQPIQIRLRDEHSGHWGHVNFDDFRFHRDDPIVREKAQVSMSKSAVRGKLPEEAAAAMTVPEGFHVDLIAAEPDLHQPIQFTIDAQGRLWVVEAFAYPQRRKDEDARDTILVFEDTDENGSYDKPFCRVSIIVPAFNIGCNSSGNSSFEVDLTETTTKSTSPISFASR